MSVAEVLDQIRRMTNPERLEVIEAASRYIRDDLLAESPLSLAEQDRRLRSAAESLKDLYLPGGELTEWTSLDMEEILDDTLPR
jgi:hypothetical protein